MPTYGELASAALTDRGNFGTYASANLGSRTAASAAVKTPAQVSAALTARGPNYAQVSSAGLVPSDVALLISRMTTPPTSGRATAIETFIAALVTAGVWDKLDLLYVLAAADAQAAGLNWKRPLENALTVGAGAPNFTADRGYQGNGTSEYLTTGFSPNLTPAGLKMSLNAMHGGAVTLSTPGANSGFDIGAQNNRLAVAARGASTTSVFSVATSGTSTITGTAFPQHVIGIRRDAANQIGFSAGSSGGSSAQASVGLPSTIDILRRNTAYSNRQVALVHCGASLTDGEAAAMTSATLAYLQAVGAAS